MPQPSPLRELDQITNANNPYFTGRNYDRAKTDTWKKDSLGITDEVAISQPPKKDFFEEFCVLKKWTIKRTP